MLALVAGVEAGRSRMTGRVSGAPTARDERTDGYGSATLGVWTGAADAGRRDELGDRVVDVEQRLEQARWHARMRHAAGTRGDGVVGECKRGNREFIYVPPRKLACARVGSA